MKILILFLFFTSLNTKNFDYYAIIRSPYFTKVFKDKSGFQKWTEDLHHLYPVNEALIKINEKVKIGFLNYSGNVLENFKDLVLSSPAVSINVSNIKPESLYTSCEKFISRHYAVPIRNKAITINTDVFTSSNRKSTKISIVIRAMFDASLKRILDSLISSLDTRVKLNELLVEVCGISFPSDGEIIRDDISGQESVVAQKVINVTIFPSIDEYLQEPHKGDVTIKLRIHKDIPYTTDLFGCSFKDQKEWKLSLCTSSIYLWKNRNLFMTPTIADESILFLLDESGSMAGHLDGRPKLDIAVNLLEKLLCNPNWKLTNREFALALFNGCSNCQILYDFSLLNEAQLEKLRQIEAKGKTPLAHAIEFGRYYLVNFSTSFNARMIILTDGEETCGESPPRVAQKTWQDLTSGNSTKKFSKFSIDIVCICDTLSPLLKKTSQKGHGKLYLLSDTLELFKDIFTYREEPKLASHYMSSSRNYTGREIDHPAQSIKKLLTRIKSVFYEKIFRKGREYHDYKTHSKR